MAQRHKLCKVKGCGFNPNSRKANIYLHLYSHFYPAVCGIQREADVFYFQRRWRLLGANPLHN